MATIAAEFWPDPNVAKLVVFVQGDARFYCKCWLPGHAGVESTTVGRLDFLGVQEFRTIDERSSEWATVTGYFAEANGAHVAAIHRPRPGGGLRTYWVRDGHERIFELVARNARMSIAPPDEAELAGNLWALEIG